MKGGCGDDDGGAPGKGRSKPSLQSHRSDGSILDEDLSRRFRAPAGGEAVDRATLGPCAGTNVGPLIPRPKPTYTDPSFPDSD